MTKETGGEKKGISQGCYQVSDFPKYMVMTMKKEKRTSFGEKQRSLVLDMLSLRKPRGNTKNCTDFSEVIGMEVIT